MTTQRAWRLISTSWGHTCKPGYSYWRKRRHGLSGGASARARSSTIGKPVQKLNRKEKVDRLKDLGNPTFAPCSG